MNESSLVAIGVYVFHLTLALGLIIRVIMRRPPVGVALAWILIIFSVPLLGAAVYFMIGEHWVSRKYIRRVEAIRDVYSDWQKGLGQRSVDSPLDISRAIDAIRRQGQSQFGFPAMPGNQVHLQLDYASVFHSMISDIDAAQHTCHLEFYIWYQGGLADEVLQAVIRAAGRGIHCRVLLDSFGSQSFLKSTSHKKLDEAGVEVAAALPVNLLSISPSRTDLRNHRKIVVIDGQIAYTGSQNMVDPRFFKQDAGVGEWVDAMARIEGPAVEALGGIFIHDWEVVTGAGLADRNADHGVTPVEAKGTTIIQAIPSGPVVNVMGILELLLTTIYSARSELIITTPYFVPDDAMLTALLSAAHSGVAVTIIIPANNDSRMVRYASRSFFDDLLAAGVKIARYQGGLLHTKSITVDGQLSMFGSVNMDMRSLLLNFEITLFVYDDDFSQQLRALQLDYIDDSELLDRDAWSRRAFRERLIENTLRLMAPLL